MKEKERRRFIMKYGGVITRRSVNVGGIYDGGLIKLRTNYRPSLPGQIIKKFSRP